MEREKLKKTAMMAGLIICAALALDYVVNGVMGLGEHSLVSTLVIATFVSVPFCYYLISQRLDLQKARDDLAAGLKARDEAEAASAAKSAFLATMSHELRTPLNAIIGYTEIMLEGAQGQRRAEDIADHGRVLNASQGLLELITDVLEYSRLEAGRMDISVSHYDPAALAHALVANVGPLVCAGGNNLTLKLGHDLGQGSGDAGKINQCLQALLSNAAKFTKNGQVSLSVYRQSLGGRDWLVFEVADTGVGISPEKLEKIFLPFTQGDDGLTRGYGGAGLGLALASRLAQLMGGSVTATSTLGAGSTFSLRAPAQFQANSADARAAAAA